MLTDLLPKNIPDRDCQLYSLTLATVDGLVRRTDGNWAGTTYKLPSLVCVSLCGNAKKADMSVSFPCQFFIDCDIVSYLCSIKAFFDNFDRVNVAYYNKSLHLKKGKNNFVVSWGEMDIHGKGFITDHSMVDCWCRI